MIFDQIGRISLGNEKRHQNNADSGLQKNHTLWYNDALFSLKTIKQYLMD